MSTSSRRLVKNNGVMGEMGRTGVRGVGRLRGEEDDESDISLGDGVGGRDFTGETTVLQGSKSDSDITRGFSGSPGDNHIICEKRCQ